MKLLFIPEGDIITIAHFISHELVISSFSASNTTLSTLGENFSVPYCVVLKRDRSLLLMSLSL